MLSQIAIPFKIEEVFQGLAETTRHFEICRRFYFS
jgi:hypothetical protein